MLDRTSIDTYKHWALALTEKWGPSKLTPAEARFEEDTSIFSISEMFEPNDLIPWATAYAFVMYENTKRIEIRDQAGGDRHAVWTPAKGWSGFRGPCASEGIMMRPGEKGLRVELGPASQEAPAFVNGSYLGKHREAKPLTFDTLPKDKKFGVPLVDVNVSMEHEVAYGDANNPIILRWYTPSAGLRYDRIPIIASWTDLKRFIHGVMYNYRNEWERSTTTDAPGATYPLYLHPITDKMERQMMVDAHRMKGARTIAKFPSFASNPIHSLAWQQCLCAAAAPFNGALYRHGDEKTWIYSPLDSPLNCGLWTKYDNGGQVHLKRMNKHGDKHNSDHVDWSQRVVMAHYFAYKIKDKAGEWVPLPDEICRLPELGGPFNGPMLADAKKGGFKP